MLRKARVSRPGPTEERTTLVDIDRVIDRLSHELTRLLDLGMPQNALKQCGGNVVKAAKLLGMSQATLCRRIKSMGSSDA